MKSNKMKIIITLIMTLGLMLTSVSFAFAAPLKNDESVNLTYKNGNINCVIKWNYDLSKVAKYEVLVTKDDDSNFYFTDQSFLKKPSKRGLLSYKIPAGPGSYSFLILLRNEYGGTINFPPEYYQITVQ